MSELIKALIDQSEKKIEKIIKQLSTFASKQRYQLQCVILNHIIEKTFQLSIKTEEFWHYVKTNIESWDFHYQNERAFEKAFSALSNVISSIAKTRNIYEKAFKKINVLWNAAKEAFARNQFVQVLRSLRRCALRNMTLKEACRAVAFAIKNRLNNSIRDVSTSRESINRDWIKIANENYDLRQIKSAVIISSSLVVCLEREKNRKITFVVFFFSMMLSSIEKKKNQKTTFVDLFFDRVSSSSSLTFSFVESSSANSSFFSSLFSITLKKLAIMTKALLNDILNSIEIRCDENFLNRFQDFVSSFVLSLRLIFFASFSLTLSTLSSFFNLSRSQKRIRSASSTSLKKRVKSANHCACVLSIKWLDDFKNARCFINLKSVEHFLEKLYYLDRQICLRHINQLRQLFELLSINDLIEMKNVLWKFLKFEEKMKIFKIDRSNLFEISKVDD
jgi:hypothetical protein